MECALRRNPTNLFKSYKLYCLTYGDLRYFRHIVILIQTKLHFDGLVLTTFSAQC